MRGRGDGVKRAVRGYWDTGLAVDMGWWGKAARTKGVDQFSYGIGYNRI